MQAGKGGSPKCTGKGKTGKVPGLRTVNKGPDGKTICNVWGNGRGCAFGDSCRNAHVCDIIMSDDKPCYKTHTRAQHKSRSSPSHAEVK
eukprot:7794542-Karenia_brevis.AAC.1